MRLARADLVILKGEKSLFWCYRYVLFVVYFLTERLLVNHLLAYRVLKQEIDANHGRYGIYRLQSTKINLGSHSISLGLHSLKIIGMAFYSP